MHDATAVCEQQRVSGECERDAKHNVFQFQPLNRPLHERIRHTQFVRETMQRWREVSDNAAAFIKENPAKAALAALGIGFAIGLLFRRD
jgi:ElaB/YqjD/DUF883 family membrane-anchored ribosome-binding protein